MVKDEFQSDDTLRDSFQLAGPVIHITGKLGTPLLFGVCNGEFLKVLVLFENDLLHRRLLSSGGIPGIRGFLLCMPLSDQFAVFDKFFHCSGAFGGVALATNYLYVV